MTQQTLEQYLTDSLRKGIRHHGLNVSATKGHGVEVIVSANGKSDAAFPARVFGNRFTSMGEADPDDALTFGDISISGIGTDDMVTVTDTSRGTHIAVEATELAGILKNYYADKSRQNIVEGEAGDLDPDPRMRD